MEPLVIKNKAQLTEAFAAHPHVKETLAAWDGEEGEEVHKALLREVQRTKGKPKYGEDWRPWLDANIFDLLEEAIEIVM